MFKKRARWGYRVSILRRRNGAEDDDGQRGADVLDDDDDDDDDNDDDVDRNACEPGADVLKLSMGG